VYPKNKPLSIRIKVPIVKYILKIVKKILMLYFLVNVKRAFLRKREKIKNNFFKIIEKPIRQK